MAWSHWEDVEVKVGGAKKSIQGTPAVVAWKKGYLHVFVHGKAPDNNIYHGTYHGELSPATWAWEVLPVTLPATALIAIGAVAWDNDRIDLFAAGADKKIFHAAWNGPHKWDSTWVVPLVGATDYTPSAASWKTGRFDVFVHTTDHRMSFLSWEGSWSTAWLNVGGYGKSLNSAPAAAASGSKRIDCFALETVDRKHLIHTAFDGTPYDSADATTRKTFDWAIPGGPTDETYEIAGDPCAASSPLGDGRVDIFARSSTNRLIHREFSKGNWTTKWEDLGSPGANRDILGEPAAVSWWEGGWTRFDCFAIGANNVLKHAMWP
jgi:hypothetical protein